MHDLVQTAILGLGPGAFDGILALGVVLTYRTSGVLNFALGATGVAGAYVAASLASQLPLALALFLGALIAGSIGTLIYLLTAGIRTRHAALVASAVTLGAWFLLQQALLHVWDASLSFPALIPATLLGVGSLAVSPLFLDALLLGLALLVCISAFKRWTKQGRMLTAIEHDREAVQPPGVRVPVILGVVWAGAALLAYLSAVCQAQLTFAPGFMSPVMLGALIASVFTGLRSLWAAFAAALALEMGRVVLENYHPGAEVHAQTLVLVLLILALLYGLRGLVPGSMRRPLWGRRT